MNDLDRRLAENWSAIEVELDAPRAGRLERLARRCGLSDETARLMAATPALRRSWVVAVLVALFFAVSAASEATATGDNRYTLFLTLAPLVPLAGVALAFGPGVDPAHELVVSTPYHGLRLLLVRSVAVFAVAIATIAVGWLLLGAPGPVLIRWILPALGLSSVTLALGTRWEPWRAAVAVGAVWLAVVVATAVASTDDLVAFGPVGQFLSLLALAVGAAVVILRRHHLDALSAS